MIKTSTLKRFTALGMIAAGLMLVSGSLSEINAQRDPFSKPGFMTPKKQGPAAVRTSKPKAEPKPVVNYAPPAVEARIEYFKRLREAALTNGTELPKVTSVLTLNEMDVTGIFKTPRGYAAIVEATPIKLSYTIYPGEKFFDGQLVAVEENRLVFRKVSKVGEGKFVASVENKPLRQYSIKDQLEGTAPVQPASQPVETASNVTPKDGDKVQPKSNPFLSPVDEMNKQSGEPATEAPTKVSKKPTKVAKRKN